MFFADARPREVIYSKPVPKWSVKEVVSWVQVLSGHLNEDYSKRFAKAGIGGEILLILDDDDLAGAPFNINTTLHRKMILAEIAKLNIAGVRQANNLWEYKVGLEFDFRL